MTLDADICELSCLYQSVHQLWFLNFRQSDQHNQTYRQPWKCVHVEKNLFIKM